MMSTDTRFPVISKIESAEIKQTRFNNTRISLQLN